MSSQSSRLTSLVLFSFFGLCLILPTVAMADDPYCARIYWINSNGDKKAFGQAGITSDHYTSSRHNLIFIPGWNGYSSDIFDITPEPITGSKPSMSTFQSNWQFSIDEFKGDTVEFNVGVFYYREFQDSASNTEDRIWNGYEYTCYDEYTETESVSMTLIEMFDEDYQRISTVKDKNIVAHSLGTQLAVKHADTLSSNYPYAITLLEVGWSGETDRVDDMVSALADVNDNTSVILGRSYKWAELYYGIFEIWDEDTAETYRTNYETMSEDNFDFWYEVDEGSGTDYDKYERQHRTVVWYWFQEEADLLFNCYKCYHLWYIPAYPFAIHVQEGDAMALECGWVLVSNPPPVFQWQCWYEYPFYERVQDAKGSHIMHDDFAYSEYKACTMDDGAPTANCY